MHALATRTVALIALLAAPTVAQDQLVKQALTKIARVEKALATLSAGDVPAANRLLGDLKWANKRLKAAYKKDTSHWRDASKRLQAADKAVRARASAPAGVKAGGGKPKVGGAKNSGATGQAKGSAKGVATNGPVIGAQFAKLQQLDKEVRNGFHNLKILNKSFMGDAYRVGSITKEIAGLKQRLAAFPQGDKNVKVVAGNLEQFEGLFDKWRGEFAADQAAAGELGKQIDAIAARYKQDQVPTKLYWPYERDKLQSWAARVAKMQRQLPKDAKIVERAVANVQLKKRSRSLLHRVVRDLPRRLQENVAEVRYACETAVKTGLQSVEFFANIDPEDKNRIANVVLTPGALDRSVQQLNDGLEAIDRAAILDKELPGEQSIDRAKQRKTIEAAIVKLRALAKSSLKDVRMPKPVGLPAAEVAELAAIATKTMARKKYGVNPIAKLVVTSKKKRKEKTEGTITGTVTGARVTSYHYVWDEYHVVTAETVGDETWLFHNLLKYYHKSDSTTPQEVWILSRRFQGTQILPTNVAK